MTIVYETCFMVKVTKQRSYIVMTEIVDKSDMHIKIWWNPFHFYRHGYVNVITNTRNNTYIKRIWHKKTHKLNSNELLYT